jgi:23S rRNA (uracil1939-C5)-methyltransferase
VFGIELSQQSIESAKANALRRRANNVRFLRADITAEIVLRQLRKCSTNDVVLLDPPRNGTAEGVIEAVASFSPGLVLHICCNIDLIPKEAKRWRTSGYELQRIIPLDSFPGMDEVETVVALRKTE